MDIHTEIREALKRARLDGRVGVYKLSKMLHAAGIDDAIWWEVLYIDQNAWYDSFINKLIFGVIKMDSEKNTPDEIWKRMNPGTPLARWAPVSTCMVSVSRVVKYFSRPLLDDEVSRLNEIHSASIKVKTVFGGTVELVSYLERDLILHVVAR